MVWGVLGFLGWGSLYKHGRIALGRKNLARIQVLFKKIIFDFNVWMLLRSF